MAILAVILTAACMTGGTMAYLTDNAQVKNTFTVGKVEITGQEPNWDPDDDGEEGGTAENIVPTQSFTKDPNIANVGNNDAYVYMEVEIPMAEVVYTDAKGIRQNDGKALCIELFEFDAEGKVTQTLTDGIGVSEANDKWTQMYKREMNGKMVYTYCYNEVLKPNTTTSSLFDRITFANIVEGQINDQKLDVDVHFYAIQTVDAEEDESNVPVKAREAYNKYVRQNEGLTGKVINSGE